MPEVTFCGEISHRSAVEIMEEHRRRVWNGAPGHLFLAEHPPTITFGKHASDSNLLVSKEFLAISGICVEMANRGGGVTFHGPGQLMVYPVWNVRRGVVSFLRNVADAIALVLADFGVDAEWRQDPAGIWCGEKKIAACGIHISKAVAIHGFCLNVGPVSPHWEMINGCGLGPGRVTSLSVQTNQHVSCDQVAPVVANRVLKRLADENFPCRMVSPS